MTMKKVFAVLASKVRRMRSGLREKPDLQIDDYVLEHFLLYNGLVGSTPENQPQYKDVRNDIVQSINDSSAHQLAIALKLPPLWWEDRLEKIFSEIATINRAGLLKCLLAQRPADDTTGDTTCLSHSDWRVRSNAARMLAFLNAKEAVPNLIALLDQGGDENRAAFCHVAYSLAKLGSDQARLALVAQLDNKEPWFSVDAAGSLSHWNLASVSADLMVAMLSGNVLDDYMAVTIARKHQASQLAEFKDEEIQEGLAEMVLSLLKALNGAFHSENHLQQQLEDVQASLNELAHSKPTPRRLNSAITLNNWVEARCPARSHRQGQSLIRDLSDRKHYESVTQTLSQPCFDSATQIGQFKHALALCSQFKLSEMSPHLVPLLKADCPMLPELMTCIATLGDLNGASKIAKLLEEAVDLDKRCSMSFAAHPVVESDTQSSEIYWSALKALGSLPDKSSLEILCRAVNDHAPDKREQALLSLQTILLSEELKEHYSGNLEELIRERTADPALGVQAAALAGIAQHKLSSLIPEVMKALHSREHSIQRRASETLLLLASSGHSHAVRLFLETSLSKEYNAGKKQRLNKVLQRLQALPL